MKKVTTREFLRNINAMTEPCEVYTRADLKGTWYPNQLTFTADQTISQLQHATAALREAMTTAQVISTSKARSTGGNVLRAADAASAPTVAGDFGAPRPAPKPKTSRRKAN